MTEQRRRTDLGRTLRARGTYSVVRCPSCKTLWVHKDLASQDTATCPRCAKTHQEHHLDAPYTSDDHLDAVGARAKLLAQDAGERAAYTSEWDDIADQEAAAYERIEATSASTSLRGPAVSPDSDYEPDVDISPFPEHVQASIDQQVDDWEARHAPATGSLPDPPRPPIDVDDRPGIHAVRPGDQLSVSPAVDLRAVGPRRRDWLPEVLEVLVDEEGPAPAITAMQSRLEDADPHAHEAGRPFTGTSALIDDLLNRDSKPDGSSSGFREAEHYFNTLAQYAARYADRSIEETTDLAAERAPHRRYDDLKQIESDRHDQLRDQLTTIATGTGVANASLEALLRGPVALQQSVTDAPSDAPTIRVWLDADAWADVRRETGLRSLATLSALAVGFRVELVLSSPGLEDLLSNRWTKWTEGNLNLTDDRDWGRVLSELIEDPGSVDLTLAAQDAVDELPSGSLKVELLANLDVDQPRSVKMLREDPEISAADGSIDRYLQDLQDLLCVYVEPAHPSNRVHLTDVGDRVQDFIGSDGRTLTDPVQSTLAEHLTDTRTSSVGAVYGADALDGEDPTAASPIAPDRRMDPEAVLANTGTAGEDAPYVQWLEGEDPQRAENWELHQRYTAPARDAAVTLVDDDQLSEFEDGRVIYLSGDWDDDRDDDVLVLTQWGGPLATLGRIAGALLSRRAWSRFLTEERLGHDLSNLSHGAVDDLEDDLGDILRYGHQVGWFSKDDESYDALKDRLEAARCALLEKLGELINSDDFDERGELFSKLHGLVASVTQLYYAVGMDVVINVRFPDTENIAKDDYRHRKFLNFLKYTVPKQTVYRRHSGYRMLLEDRETKLKQRLGYSDDLDPADPTMDWTARFIISGPTATSYREDISAALATELGNARDDVQAGEEETAVMELPVAIGNSFVAIKDLVKEWADRKGFILGRESSGTPTAREATLLLLRALSKDVSSKDEDEPLPRRANPYVVTETFLRMTNSGDYTEYLGIFDLEAGLARLPDGRLLPSAKPSERAIVQTLLLASEPLARQTIIDEEHADISGRSYDEYIKGLRALGIVHSAENNGRQAWTATLAPWWTEYRSRSTTPSVDSVDDLPEDPAERELLEDFLDRVADVLPEFPDSFSIATASPAEIYDTFAAPARWRPFIVNGLPESSLSLPPPTETGDADCTVVSQGSPPVEGPGSQSTLDQPGNPGTAVVSGHGKTAELDD